MSKAVKLARAVGTGGVLEDGEIQAAQVTGLATVATTNSYTDLTNKPTIPSITGLASETYVNTQINNLIDNAPGTLNTLKEIADQLATDQSAVGALTAVVNSKASTASLAAVATSGSYTDLLNKPAGGTTYIKKTSSYTAADRDGIIADTATGSFTVFLPATPGVGTQVNIVDGHNWGTNSLTVGRNGSTIEGLAENLVLDIAGVSVQFIYDGATWEVFAQAGVLGANTVPASSVTGLAPVATSGSYTDLSNKPTLFSGSYTDLINKPTIISLKVSSIDYPGDDLAADPAGGQTITLTGTGFAAGAQVLVETTVASVVTVVDSTTITFIAPARAAGTYVLYVVNTDGSVALSLPGISYSGTPAWSTGAGTLGTRIETSTINTALSASSNSAITYSLVSGSLPPGSTLNTSTGVISGTSPLVGGSTTYNFTVRATDLENQDTDRAFSLTISPDAVTWSNPVNNATITAGIGDAVNLALAAAAASGNSVTYTANQLPAGLSVVGSAVTGTATTPGNVSTTLTATAANSLKTTTRTITWNIVLLADPNFRNVVLLLSADGVNGSQNNTFLDSSPNNFAITRNSNTRQGSFSPYGTLWSNYFDGTADYIRTPYIDFGTGDFTIEGWFFRLNSTDVTAASGQGTVGSSSQNIQLIRFGENGANNISSYFQNAYVFNNVTVPAIAAGNWFHYAITRQSGTVRAFCNGTLVASGTNTQSVGISLIGAFDYGPNPYSEFAGYISNFRVVRFTALYTSNFTPSTTPLTAVSGTSLLTCQSNRFVDNSTNNYTLTINGDTSIQRFNPFAPSAAYSAATLSGSAYFDGALDRLSISNLAFDPRNTTWTYETYIYRSNSNQDLFSSQDDRTYIDWLGAVLYLAYDYDNLVWTIGDILNQWIHFALVSVNGTATLYINGVSQGSRTTTRSSRGTLTGWNIGARGDNTSTFYDKFGYLSNTRLVVGTAVYTTNFTPPTAPVTAIAGTALLLNYTNASIFDGAMLNPIETMGNAQISNTTTRFGTGSIAFDGNGDRLAIPASPSLNLTNNFTIEMWVNLTALPVYSILFDISSTGTAGSGMTELWVESNGSVGYYARGAILLTTPAGAVTSNTWHHIAVVKSGTLQVLYVNGVARASIESTVQPNTNLPFWIGDRPAGAVSAQYPLTGFIDDLRITNGIARYTGNFTPPTLASPTR